MPEQSQPRPSDAVLVRVSPEILQRMKTGDVEPVVILGVQDAGDGTYDMTLKVPDGLSKELQLAQALRLIRDTTAGFGANYADKTLKRLGIEDPEDDCAVF